jgi:hypothetical protein
LTLNVPLRKVYIAVPSEKVRPILWYVRVECARLRGEEPCMGGAITMQAYELVASFVNRSNLLKSWENIDTCAVSP